MTTEEWRSRVNVFTPEPAERHGEILARLIRDVDRAQHVQNAPLAALATEYGLTLQTTDRDYGRFGGLRWQNPIA